MTKDTFFLAGLIALAAGWPIWTGLFFALWLISTIVEIAK